MATTNTNKQPVFVDRPLIERKRITNQVVGAAGNCCCPKLKLVVKPWSKSLSQQAPKSNKSPPKKEKKKDLDLSLIHI